MFSRLKRLNLAESDETISVIYSFCRADVVGGKISSADEVEDWSWTAPTDEFMCSSCKVFAGLGGLILGWRA